MPLQTIDNDVVGSGCDTTVYSAAGISGGKLQWVQLSVNLRTKSQMQRERKIENIEKIGS